MREVKMAAVSSPKLSREAAGSCRPNVTSAVAWQILVIDCALAGATRLALAVTSRGFRSDADTFESWAGTLGSHPLNRFYATARTPDHLPGDLWILKAVEWLFIALGGNDVHGSTFAFLIQVVATLGDLLSGVMIFLLVRRQASDRAASVCARWYLFNPATIVLSGIWGQWDSISLGLLLTGLWLLLRRTGWWILSAPLMAWALLIKPQLALAVVCLLPLVWVRARRGAESWQTNRHRVSALASVSAWATAAVTTAYVLLLPFGVHLVRASEPASTLFARSRAAMDLYPFTTMGAANIWMLPAGSLERIRDDRGGMWGLPPDAWGLLLLALALVVVASGYRRLCITLGTESAAIWAATAALFAGFLFSTRVHERYALPVLALAVVCMGVPPRARAWLLCCGMLSVCLCLNQVMVLQSGFKLPGGRLVEFNRLWWTGLAGSYVMAFAIVVAQAWWRKPQYRAGESSST